MDFAEIWGVFEWQEMIEKSKLGIEEVIIDEDCWEDARDIEWDFKGFWNLFEF